MFLVLPANMLFAGPYSDALGKKLMASTTPAEKTICAKWMFASLSLHPDIKNLASITAQQRVEANRAFATLVAHMLTETCVLEARDAVKYEGNTAIDSAINAFAQIASKELFANPAVSQGLGELEKFIDRNSLLKTLAQTPVSSKAK